MVAEPEKASNTSYLKFTSRDWAHRISLLMLSGWTILPKQEGPFTASTSKLLVRLHCDLIFRVPFVTSIVPKFKEDPLALLEQIHKAGMKAGVAISPDTPSTAVTDEVANAADMLLVMTVYPGTGLCLSIVSHQFFPLLVCT